MLLDACCGSGSGITSACMPACTLSKNSEQLVHLVAIFVRYLRMLNVLSYAKHCDLVRGHGAPKAWIWECQQLWLRYPDGLAFPSNGRPDTHVSGPRIDESCWNKHRKR
jgi:hypothetical protein